jgi:hypothetical protein
VHYLRLMSLFYQLLHRLNGLLEPGGVLHMDERGGGGEVEGFGGKVCII